ncbi:MAG: DUF4124 domain-containing protein, partial [Rhizobacter sp.]
MRIELLAFVLLALGAAEAGAAEVYKWTDDKGRTHYSSTPPPEKTAKPKTVDLKVTAPSETKVEAQAGDALGSAMRQQEPSTPQPAPERFGRKSPPAPAWSSTRPADPAASCKEAWARYNESTRCFDRFRDSGHMSNSRNWRPG